MNTEPSEREEAPERDAKLAAQAIWNRFWTDLTSDKWSVGDIESVLRPHFDNVATRMRERCVEKVRDLAVEKGVRNFGRMTLTVHEVADALMSLTLDGEKEP